MPTRFANSSPGDSIQYTATADWLQNLFAPVFEDRLHFGGELVGQRAVDQAVIEGQGEVAHRADGDGIVDHHRLLFDAAHAQDGYLRLVDHGRREDAAEAAEVGD